MELQTLKAASRNPDGTSVARRVRQRGIVPGVLYGGGQQPICLGINLREFQRLLHGHRGEHAVVRLEIDDDPKLSSPALLKAVQHHPARGDVLHADFQRIRLDEKIITTVPIVLVGHARGVVEGGVLDHQLREMEVECLALDAPEQIEVVVSELDIGDSTHVADVTGPENVRIVTDPERTIAAVLAPRIIRAAEVAEEGAELAEEAVEGEKEGEPVQPAEE